jgi:hypothetical protein
LQPQGPCRSHDEVEDEVADVLDRLDGAVRVREVVDPEKLPGAPHQPPYGEVPREVEVRELARRNRETGCYGSAAREP